MKIRGIVLCLVWLLCLSLPAGCSSQDPVGGSMAVHPGASYVGLYAGGPFTLTVKTTGDDLIKANVGWRATAEDWVLWEFSGTLAEDGATLAFNDCTVTTISVDADGQETRTPGAAVKTGSLVFGEGVATLTVEGEDMLQRVTFERFADGEND